ncbi:MAG: NADH-quinone oxidoreductase subunit E, partial [Pseudomonadota bacterium]
PELFTEAPAGGGDDLRQLKGVGPKLEGVLHDLGVYTFAQIASWGPEEIAWVDARLNFKGRIERDDWVGQAKALAGGDFVGNG